MFDRLWVWLSGPRPETERERWDRIMGPAIQRFADADAALRDCLVQHGAVIPPLPRGIGDYPGDEE